MQLLVKHSFKSKNRLRGPKAYIIDPGLHNNRENSMAAKAIGWRLENIVYIELLRRCANDFLDIYFYKPSSREKEVDFVICDRNKATQLVQVAYDISSEKTFKRETSALVTASEALNCDNLFLIAFTETRNVEVAGKTIHIMSALDWLLKK
ncbi:DUF4143 domain-containing protein [Sodaliphilus sp.]|uniref:DUF4143 domain-containing protein n=1 Tax=Sodaliphilus sp. TaxID=2815818 RepID=UPI0038910DA1